MNAATPIGLTFKIGKYRFRIWKHGYEWDNGLEGKVKFFYWAPIRRKIRSVVRSIKRDQLNQKESK